MSELDRIFSLGSLMMTILGVPALVLTLLVVLAMAMATPLQHIGAETIQTFAPNKFDPDCAKSINVTVSWGSCQAHYALVGVAVGIVMIPMVGIAFGVLCFALGLIPWAIMKLVQRGR